MKTVNPLKFKGIWIPAVIVLSELTYGQKMLWSIINSLCSDTHPCFASNEWLSSAINTSISSINKMMSDMKRDGWVEVLSFNGRTRLMVARVPESAKQNLAEKLTQFEQMSIAENEEAECRKTLSECSFLAGRSAKKDMQNDPSYIVYNKEDSKEDNSTTRIVVNDHAPDSKAKPSRLRKSSKPSMEDILHAEKIYQIYPKHAGKGAAIKSIIKALKSISFDELLVLTQKYAAARKGEPKKFTPHPSTWFNQERWKDDPSTWSDARPGENDPFADPPGTIKAYIDPQTGETKPW